MPDLSQPVSWTDALKGRNDDDLKWIAVLDDLQGNILKGHGRHHTANVFLRFAPGRIEEARRFLAALAADITPALRQLMDAQRFKATGQDAGPFVSVLLSAQGFAALGLAGGSPQEPAFVAGMAARQAVLADKATDIWDDTFRSGVHAMVLLAAEGTTVDDPVPRNDLMARFFDRVALTAGAVEIAGTDLGDQLMNGEGHGIEHFGYVDGRSQPLALAEDLAAEQPGGPRSGVWDPSIPPSQLLVPDPLGASAETSFGSYFVYRKLEQDVKKFKDEVENRPDGKPDTGDLFGASVVGRWENGFPVSTMTGHMTTMPPLPASGVGNAFDFSSDTDGLKCPFAAHIRKTNPRRPETQSVLMARRGITYGLRHDDPHGDDDKPSGGVGLLFQSYQSSIEGQFEVTQASWANNEGFDFNAPPGLKPVGIDPIIGNSNNDGSPPVGQQFTHIWGVSLRDRMPLSGFIHLKGGEYFFAPAISTLKRLVP
jgi:Dyp-type peroxidase family